jgi:hypothetical protein
MTQTLLAYDQMVDDALRGVMVRALRQVESRGLPDDHHFYITFRTDHPRAVLSTDLKARYPEEITIVLQHQFWELKVAEASFSVGLSFNQTPQTLVVPFAAVTAFVDPSVKFGLQFRAAGPGEDGGKEPEAAVAEPTGEAPPTAASDNIVALDHFRKK